MGPLLRSIAVAVLFGPAFLGHAQGTLTTYYTIPPTNGCDGLWVYGPAAALWDSCPGPITYSTDPWGCAQNQGGGFTPFWVVGDTVFSILCSLPCNMQVWNSDGLCSAALCGLPATGVSQMEADALRVSFPNPLGNDGVLNLDLTGTQVSAVQVVDLSGRTLRSERITSTVVQLDLHALSAGTYLLKHLSSTTCLRTERIVIQ